MSNFSKLAEVVFKGDIKSVKEVTKELIDGGAAPLDIINKGLIGGMDLVTPKFKNGEMFVPEVMRSAKTMAMGLEVVKPLILEGEVPTSGKVLIGTVKGDLHDIGKNLVIMILESGGFKVIDLGIDVATTVFIEAVKEHKPDILGLSALLSTTMMEMKAILDALEAAGLRDQVKVILGGAPVSQEFADQIGADGFAMDAITTKELCLELV
ncbi:MAG: cobalamin B12-binding domain-containing protein [Eubacteriales bacterium]